MKKRILYSILNEWRDEDIEDFPLDLDDDMDFEVTSSNMSDEPDLKDVDFELSTLHSQYEYFPKTRDELKEIVDMEIEKQGGVHVNLNMIDTSKITSMENMFSYYESLETLDVSRWKVQKVENMKEMFWSCKSLRELDVSRWKVSKVNDMAGMFNNCQSLHTLDVSKWDVSSVRDMTCMFNNCQSLRTLDVSRWKVSKVRDMGYMFDICKLLQYLDVSGWDVSGVTNMFSMFKNCESLHTDTRMWKINTNKTTDMYYNAPNIKHD